MAVAYMSKGNRLFFFDRFERLCSNSVEMSTFSFCTIQALSGLWASKFFEQETSLGVHLKRAQRGACVVMLTVHRIQRCIFQAAFCLNATYAHKISSSFIRFAPKAAISCILSAALFLLHRCDHFRLYQLVFVLSLCISK